MVDFKGSQFEREIMLWGKGNDFFVTQRGSKPATAQGVGIFDHLIMLTDQTVLSFKLLSIRT